MKKSLLLLLVVALFVSACNPAKSTDDEEQAEALFVPDEIPGEVVYVPFPFAINLDGNLEDWQKLPFYTVDSGPNLSPDPLENGSFTFAVAADADSFYITMQMPDKNIVAGQHGTEFWNEDSMEFYINASGNLAAKSYTTNIFQLNFNAADIGNTDPDALTITGVFSTDVPVKGYVFKTEIGWGMEAALPLEGIIKPEHGKEIGFQAQINGATTKDRDVKLIWSKADTKDESWQYPYLFGRAIFFELGRKDIPQPSVVQAQPTPTAIPAPEPMTALVSVNQTGYFPAGRKIALAAIAAAEPQDWQLLDAKNQVLLSGKTIVKGEDQRSGDFLHQIDFSEFTTEGESFSISVGDLKSVPFSIKASIYETLKKDAMAYFYHNRSGIAIESQYVGDAWARPAGHITDNNVTCYKGKDPDGNTWDGCDYTLDVAGGWYDAGDFGKYVVNGGISVWTLLNLFEQQPTDFPDGALAIPEGSNGIPDILDEARWEMEFLLSMQVPEGQKLEGMVHHKIHDESWAGIPMTPPNEVENDNDHLIDGAGRYLFPPSTAATLNLAATAAASARIWQELDPAFSQQCLTAAEKAWQAALEHPTIFAGNTPGAGGGNYDDQNVSDEFYWAASELFISTGKETYQDFLLKSPQFGKAEAFEWGTTAALGSFSLLSIQNNLPADKMQILKQNLIDYADNLLTVQAQDGYSVLIEGKYPWGSNGQILNNMMLVSLAHKLSADRKYLDAVRSSMDYILGRNPVNQSYVSGYGTYAMLHPHHRFWANDPANGYPPPPAGAVSGGPNANPDDPAANNANLASLPESKRYIDDIGSYTTNEVTINWNAPLVWVSAYLDANRDE